MTMLMKHGDVVQIDCRDPYDAVTRLRMCFEAGAAAVLLPSREPQNIVDQWLDDIAPFINQRMHEIGACTIMRTSGSMGKPKTALHYLRHHIANAGPAAKNVEYNNGSCWLLSLPLYHVGGLGILVRSIVTGGAIAIPDAGMTLCDALEKYPVTHISLVPTQLHRLLKDPKAVAQLRKLKAITLGGAPLGKKTLEMALAHDLPIVAIYGLTETSSQITATGVEVTKGGLETSGRALGSCEIKISEQNEILVRGESLFAGYVQQTCDPRKGGGTELLADARDANGYFHTGDLGSLDESGSLSVFGRKDNLIISGGENIQPEEVEKALLAHPKVLEAVVVAIESEEFGQRPIAFIRPVDGSSLDELELKKELRQQVAAFKIPDQFLAWPKNAPESLKTPRKWFTAFAHDKLVIGRANF